MEGRIGQGGRVKERNGRIEGKGYSESYGISDCISRFLRWRFNSWLAFRKTNGPMKVGEEDGHRIWDILCPPSLYRAIYGGRLPARRCAVMLCASECSLIFCLRRGPPP